MSTIKTGTYEKYGARYATLTLTDGDYALTVTPEKGGMATSFTKAGEEYLWLRDGNFESTDRPRCGIPILFPNCSKPDGGVHHFGGADYPIEVHGLADLLPWQVKTASDDAIELTLTPNGLTKFVYPFDFLLTMRYTLAGNTATLALTVANTGSQGRTACRPGRHHPDPQARQRRFHPAADRRQEPHGHAGRRQRPYRHGGF